MNKTIWLTACAACALGAATAPSLLAAQPNPAPANAVPADAPATAADLASPKFGTWGYDASGEDAKASPGVDFFRYANGAWYDREQIPADRTGFGNFDQLAMLSEARTRLLIETAAAGRSTDRDALKVGDLYNAFMDQAHVDRLDTQPLAADLDAIRSETNRKAVAALMGKASMGFQAAIFDVSIDPDEKAPNHYVVQLNTAGLGLPDRDYYLKPAFADKKAAYQAYVATMLGLIGWPDAQGEAQAVVDFESRIAEASWSRAEQRDPEKIYNPMTVDALAAYAPGFDFAGFLASADLASTTQVIVQTNTAFPKVAAIFVAEPLDTLKAWQAFHVADAAAPYLSDRFVQARFAFQNKALRGQPEIQPRWKRAVAFVNGAMGESVGRMYVAQYFPPEAKAKVDAMVADLKAALAGRIQRLSWMSPETKAKALEKLSKLTVKIGYPVKWRDYTTYRVSSDDLYGDAERSQGFDWRRQVARMNKPVDKLEWDMTPQTVNAYYDPSNNEIVFPAAILQPPFFDPTADPAIDYGGIGGVIGHEMTHGFDDEGRKFDGDGVMRDWWTPQDAVRFQAEAAKLGAQFSKFEVQPGVFVNGDLTMGENIADFGGISLALDAYHASLHGQPAPVIDGLTGDQRVFLGWAQVWREKLRDDAQREHAVADPHSPPRFRVDGPLRNVDAWYAAFAIKPTDPMYVAPEQRVRIW
jgi:putative endopeptidase